MKIITSELLEMSYDELIEYFIKKNGQPEHDYFHTEECRSVHEKNSRTKEGLEIHHIDENKYALLSSKESAKMHPYECQKAVRLVYVNVLEHLLLHIKIYEEECQKFVKTGKHPKLGIIGVYFLSNRINGYFSKESPPEGWHKNMFNAIKENYDDFVKELLYHLNVKRNYFKNKNWRLYNEIKTLSKIQNGNVDKNLFKLLLKENADIFPFYVGDCVYHDKFGKGKVLHIGFIKKDDYVIYEIDFEECGKKYIAAIYQGMRRV